MKPGELSNRGNGIVVIWSFGLPFLPGYASAERHGHPQLPRERPSVNVSVYREGKLDFYLLQEYQPGDVSWDEDGTWTFADCRFTSAVIGDDRVLEMSLDMPVPASTERFTATAKIVGHARTQGPGESSNPVHDWSPLAGPSRATVTAHHGAREWQISGRGYHDRNGGNVGMHAQGFERWLWGRLPFEGFERIYYLSWPHAGEPQFYGLDVLADGTTQHAPALEVALGPTGRSYTGPVYPKSFSLTANGRPWLDIQTRHVVDEGPFYMRFMVSGKAAGQTALGFGELVLPDAIDSDLMRPLVKMRVHHTARPNSMWLPLFTGPRDGRVSRLVSSWLG